MGLLDFFTAKPTQEKFARLALQAFADSGHAGPLSYDAGEFRLVGDSGSAEIYNLHNAYRDYCEAGRKRRPEVLAHYIRSMQAPVMPATFAEARAGLRPVLRGRSILEYMRLMQAGLPATQPQPFKDGSAPFSADSVLMLAYDSPHSIQTLSHTALTDWGVSFDAALAVALDNLRDMTVANFVQVAPGLLMAAWDDSYEASRILLADLFFRLEVGGDPVVMIPTRNRLLVASSNDSVAQLAMLALSRSFASDEGRSISALMYRFEQGKAVAYQPADAEVRAQLAQLKKIYLADDYASQKQLLDKANQQNEVDIFVATCQLVQRRDSGHLISYGVWTEGVDTLLPEVDLVALVRPDDGREHGVGAPKLVAWDDLRASIGELAHSVEGYPARYRLRNFPSQDQLDALTAREF
ncbi:hypothetical protein RugamoR64_24010 [Duganella rhizosphaerae]|uniref:hypothetical protein n=1 Tax=Duganella rhizosphaerae TaxID=2885763 RepID=UPI0030EAA895